MDAISTPCLIVHGHNDPTAEILEYEGAMPMKDWVYQIVLENCGHFPMLDGGPKFKHLMTGFLALDYDKIPQDMQL